MQAKLAALEPILHYHDRDTVVEIKVVNLSHAAECANDSDKQRDRHRNDKRRSTGRRLHRKEVYCIYGFDALIDSSGGCK